MIKKIFLCVPVLLLLSACTPFKSNIRKINSIDQAQHVFETATPDDLFVFDIDDVIFEPQDLDVQKRFYKNPSLIKNNKSLDDYFKINNYPQKDCLFLLSMLNGKIQPIEQKLINNILELQKRNIKVITLSHFYSAKCDLIERTEDWRYQQLLSLGLDLSQSFDQQEILLNELQQTDFAQKYKAKRAIYPNPTLYYKGVIGTNQYPKGIVLKSFLQKMKLKPAHVYFFDDKQKNIASVIHEMKNMDIPCQAFLYAAATTNRSNDELDLDVAALRIKLIKQRKNYVTQFQL